MEETLYRITLFITGLINLGMAVYLQCHTSRYVKYHIYYLTRILTAVWMASFAIGYFLHAAFIWRNTWATAASALTVTYFHIGALCFSWGYTSLLDPTYLKWRIVIRDLIIFVFGLLGYWTVAFLWKDAPTYTLLSFIIFFIYAMWIVIVFYRTYNRVSYRMLKMSLGSVSGFVRWMQVCCDMIILFGVGSVTITGIFANELLPYVVLLFLGVGMFGYMVYSLEKYGEVVASATQTAIRVAVSEKKSRRSRLKGLKRLKLMVLMALATLTFTSCSLKDQQHTVGEQLKVDSLLNVAHRAHDYEKILQLADQQEKAGVLSTLKACYWRGYAYSGMHRMRQAENEWKEAVSQHVFNADDLEYYSMSANRLAGLLYIKFDYEGTIRVTMSAMKLLDEKKYTNTTDYANLLVYVGNCQLKLGNPHEAADSYEQAFQSFLQLTREHETDISCFTSATIGMLNIIYAYTQTGHYQEADKWTKHLEELLVCYTKLPQGNEGFYDKQWARLHFFRAWILAGMGHEADAEKAYQTALKTHYAQTGEGKIDATNYLMTAHRWNEAARNFEDLESLIKKYDAQMTIDNLHTYMLPKYIANMEAHRTDSALAIGRQICSVLDTAIVRERQNDAVELAAIYDMQTKETQIAQQKASLSTQRFVSTAITLGLLIIAFSLFIYFRHQSAMRLESAYHDLEIANARAQESSRMKSEFIRQISHEIRTPLNILSGYSQVITTPDMDIDEKTREKINLQITENTTRITELVNKMLEMSDAKSMTVIERNDSISAVEIASEAVEDSDIVNVKHLTFTMQVADDVENVVLTTNEQAAVRALTLLLDNARKFTAPAETHESGVTAVADEKQRVTLRLKVVDDAVCFEVEDTGIGVPEEEAEHIFEEFVQLDEYYNGTGIGLTVARSLARRLGGDVVLDTSYTDGARFILMLQKA